MPPYEKPRVRAEHQPYRHGGEIRLASIAPLASAYPDDPWRWDLLAAMDGTRTHTQVLDHLANTHPDVPTDLIDKAVTDLTWAGHLEDAATANPPTATGPDGRYTRQLRYFEMVKPHDDRPAWQLQRDLDKAAVAVVGVGGAGSAAAWALAAAGVGLLHLVDPDTVELSNLSRQLLYTQHDIGRPKVDAAAERLRQVNPTVTVTVAEGEVGRTISLSGLMPLHDLTILAGVEPHELLPDANRAALATASAWIDTGYHGPAVTTGLYAPGTGTACWECLRRADAAASGLGDLTGQDLVRALPTPVGHPATAVTAMLSGTLAAHAAIAHLTGATPWQSGTVHHHNLITNKARTVTHPRNPACPACGPR